MSVNFRGEKNYDEAFRQVYYIFENKRKKPSLISRPSGRFRAVLNQERKSDLSKFIAIIYIQSTFPKIKVKCKVRLYACSVIKHL